MAQDQSEETHLLSDSNPAPAPLSQVQLRPGSNCSDTPSHLLQVRASPTHGLGARQIKTKISAADMVNFTCQKQQHSAVQSVSVHYYNLICYLDLEQNAKCWQNSAGLAAPVNGTDRQSFSLRSFSPKFLVSQSYLDFTLQHVTMVLTKY